MKCLGWPAVGCVRSVVESVCVESLAEYFVEYVEFDVCE
jgi:hypothetical protein